MQPESLAPGPAGERSQCDLAGGCPLADLTGSLSNPPQDRQSLLRVRSPAWRDLGLSSRASPGVGRWQEPGWTREPLLLKLERRGIRRGEAEKRKHPLLISLCWAKPKPHFLKSPIFFTQNYYKKNQNTRCFLALRPAKQKTNTPFADIIVTVTIMPQPGRIRKC